LLHISGEQIMSSAESCGCGSGDVTISGLVRQKYGEIARDVSKGRSLTCCSPGKFKQGTDPISSNLYQDSELASLPEQAVLASLGCGNPTLLADLHEGEVVLDLGSGGGIDVLLSARRVGPTGKAYGLDMTDDMLALARANASRAGATNVEFLKGELEQIPLPDNSVDVIISNCVINLSADKPRALAEAFRVLKPGGRFAVSDVVVRGSLSSAVRKNMELWVGCVAGALGEQEFIELLNATGFEGASIEPTRIYEFDEASALVASAGEASEVLAREISGCVMGAFVRASKPVAAASGAACCGSECCR
jgi:SAM-dependent methyltransferase